MKKLLLIIFALITLTNAQGITNTLGGNTANDKFIVENSDLEAGLVVTGEGNVGIGTTSPLSKLSVGGDGYSMAAICAESILENGYAVAGWAKNNADHENYGGYFLSDGGIGIGVYGQANGNEGRGVEGLAANSGEVTNYGGYFRAYGRSGHGVYGSAEGIDGRGVFGYASNTGDVTNYGGYFTAGGSYGVGVLGHASNTEYEKNYGGRFTAEGGSGVGVYGVASGNDGRGVFGYAYGSNGKGVVGIGNAYAFYAAGPGINYGEASSIRWKTNVVEIDNPLEKLAELRGVYFDWDEEHGGLHDIGCIAEEVGKILPEIVVYEENGIDADGMDYSKLTPILIEAIKALQKRVEELERK